MQLDGQAQGLGRFEDLLGLGQREGDAFAEHVHGIDQAFGGQRRQHDLTDQIRVFLAAASILWRQRMGP